MKDIRWDVTRIWFTMVIGGGDVARIWLTMVIAGFFLSTGLRNSSISYFSFLDFTIKWSIEVNTICFFHAYILFYYYFFNVATWPACFRATLLSAREGMFYLCFKRPKTHWNIFCFSALKSPFDSHWLRAMIITIPSGFLDLLVCEVDGFYCSACWNTKF